MWLGTDALVDFMAICEVVLTPAPRRILNLLGSELQRLCYSSSYLQLFRSSDKILTPRSGEVSVEVAASRTASQGCTNIAHLVI